MKVNKTKYFVPGPCDRLREAARMYMCINHQCMLRRRFIMSAKVQYNEVRKYFIGRERKQVECKIYSKLN